MAFKISIAPECLLRRFAVYVVIAKYKGKTSVYVGKTGDNRSGCNPIISRCGNHFSYNRIHSQIRNKIAFHEKWKYVYLFEHFDRYYEKSNRRSIDKINEMERWLNIKVAAEINATENVRMLNPFSGKLKAGNRVFRTKANEKKLNNIIQLLRTELRQECNF